MSTSVKFFHSEMPGAPQCSGTAGALLAILDACLITGFGLQTASSASVVSGVCTLVLPTTPAMRVGSVALVAGATPAPLNGEHRITAITSNSVSFATAEADTTPTGTITVKLAPAGWIKAFSGTNAAAYTVDSALHPDSTGILCKVDDTTPLNAKIKGYTSMTDVDTGLGDFPTTLQTDLYVFKSNADDATARSWMVVCDSRMVYVGVHNFTSDNTNYGLAWWGFGEFLSKKAADDYRFLVGGNFYTAGVPGPNQAYSIVSSTSTFTYIARNHLGIGGGVNARLMSWGGDYGTSGSPAAPLAYPNAADYGLYLCPADVAENDPKTLRGKFPGMFMLPHRLIRQICPDAITPYLGDNVPGYPGRTIGFMPCFYNSGDWTVVAFDLTGPWEH